MLLSNAVGGCMAIEDAYELANILTDSLEKAGGDSSNLDVQTAFKQYQERRMMRASAIHGMAGMAAFMASTYLVLIPATPHHLHNYVSLISL
jgi:zeaxanthin epoxidase